MKDINTFTLTHHASQQMHARGFSKDAVAETLKYGRTTHTKGAIYYSVGKREIKKFRDFGIDLRKCEGLHIICTNDKPHLIKTMYRNHDFRRVLRLRSRNRRYFKDERQSHNCI